jgi:hypothetical protein
VTPSTANFLFITYKLKKLLCNFQLICVTYSTTHCFSFIISYKLNKFSALLLFNAHLHIENFFHSFVLTNICCSPPLLIFSPSVHLFRFIKYYFSFTYVCSRSFVLFLIHLTLFTVYLEYSTYFLFQLKKPIVLRWFRSFSVFSILIFFLPVLLF